MRPSKPSSDFVAGLVSAVGAVLIITAMAQFTSWAMRTDLAAWWTSPQWSPADLVSGALSILVLVMVVVAIIYGLRVFRTAS